MRRVKIFCFIEIILSFLFFSCQFFSKDNMMDYLNSKTKDIEVGDVVFQKKYPLDNEKVISVPSNQDVVIKYLIQNPKNLPLSADIFNLADIDIENARLDAESSGNLDLALELESPYTFSLEKNSILKITLKKEMLKVMEQGGTVSPIINLYASGYGKEIPQYIKQIRSNSKPPIVQGAVLMLDSSYKREQTSYHNHSYGKYVLCFNLPEELFIVEGIHTDVKTITIKGLSNVNSVLLEDGINLSIESETSTDIYGNTIVTWKYDETFLPSSRPVGLIKNVYNSTDSGNGLPAVNFSPGMYPVYITDNAYGFYGDNRSYEIILTDTKGLKSSFVLNNKSKQLSKVRANITDGGNYSLIDEITGETAEFFDLVLRAPYRTEGTANDSVSDVYIYYKLYEKIDSRIVLLEEGYYLNEWTYPLPEGDYYLETFARKEGYIDSEILKCNFYIGRIPITVDIVELEDYIVHISINPEKFYKSTFTTDHTVSLTVKVFDKNGNEITEDTPIKFSEIVGTPEISLWDKDTKYEPKGPNGLYVADEQYLNTNPFTYILPEYMKYAPSETDYKIRVVLPVNTYFVSSYSSEFFIKVFDN